MTPVERAARILLMCAVLAVAAAVTRDFFRYIGHYPYLATDDGLANVSYSLATHGRYGFQTSPIQGFTELPRHQAFFNFGPWYFYLGAGLIWMFGYSLTLLRSIHLAAILAIAATGCWWFGRRRQVASGALLSLGLLYSFDIGQWPMVRPDIAVSVFAVMFIVAAGLAIEKESAAAWFAAGLAAGCAALTHLIAWTLLPCCVVTLAVALASERSSKRTAAIMLVSVALGMIAAATMFYASFGFRVRDHLRMLFAYRQYLDGTATASGTYRSIVLAHLEQGFWYLSPLARAAVACAVAASAVLLMASRRQPLAIRRPTLAVLLPPVAVLGFYVIGLGFYTSIHTGYAILTQVAAWWSVAAGAATIMWLAERRWPSASRAPATAVVLVLVVAAGVQLYARSGSDARLRFVREWVGIQDYTDRVAELVPEGATVWGPTLFAIDTPGRVQLVEAPEALSILALARRSHPVDVSSIAPDYVIWAYSDNRDHMVQASRGLRAIKFPGDIFRRVNDDLGGVHYRIVGMVAAPPYGVTRIYERTMKSVDVPWRLPAVSVYDVATQSWDRRLDGPQPFRFIQAKPVLFDVDFAASRREPVSADRSVVADLAAGRYLLRVRVGRSAGSKDPMALGVTSGPSIREDLGGLGPSVDFTPYAPGDDEAYLIREHPGGPLYVSQFDKGQGASIDAVEVYQVRPTLHDDQRAEHQVFRGMPPLASWIPLTSAGVRARLADAGSLEVEGDASRQGFQIQSPPVPARHRAVATVRAAVTTEQGSVCVGALNGTGAQWLASGGPPSRDFTFTVDDTAAFRLVYYNCSATDAGNAPSRFSVASARYALDDPGPYVDRLIALLGPAPAAASAVVFDPRVRAFPAGLALTPKDIAAEAQMPVRPADIQFSAPIVTVAGDGWTIKGKADTAFSYLLRSKSRKVGDRRRLVAQVVVREGGVTVGLLRNDQWTGQVNLTTPGEFIVVIEPPGPGEYDVVVANDLADRPLTNDVVVSRMGWVLR